MATTLSAGDIAFVEFASSEPKSFAFVLLRDIEAGTAINFTDNGWRSPANAFRANEGTIAWTAESELAAGTVIRLSNLQNPFNLSTSGDQILAYQGTAATPNFVAAIQFGGATWDADATSAGTSALPLGLTDGTNAAAFGNFNNGTYTGPLSGDAATIRTALNDLANWNTSEAAIPQFGGTFVLVASDAPSVAIEVSPASAEEADGEFVYTITGRNLAEDVTVTVAFSGTADAEDFEGTTPLAPRSLTLTPDQPTQSFTLTVRDDAVAEPDETTTATISVPDGGPAVVTSRATATIVNDDGIALTRISAIQGTRDEQTAYTAGSDTYTDGSPLRGQTVTVEAIVVGDFQDGDGDATRNLRGFFIQQEATLDDPAGASRGVFVFAPAGLDVNIGDKVRVTGQVSEYFGQTQINVAADGVSLVQADAVADVDTLAVDVTLAGNGVSTGQGGRFQPDLEDYEGMLIRLPDALTISEQFQLARFNEIRLFNTNGYEQTGSNGETVTGARPFQFTQHNAPDEAGYEAHLREVGSRTIVYDDGENLQNRPITGLDGYGPVYDTDTAPRMGDTVTGLTGVLEYGWAGNAASGATWRVRSVEDGANTFERGNANPAPTAESYAVEGDLKIATMNVLNFFTTLSGTTANGSSPRGANNQAEYERQLDKLVAALTALDADVVGLLEIENDFRTAGNAPPAVEALVSALNDATAPGTYDWVRPGRDFVGGDAISNVFIYKLENVSIAAGTNPAILDDANPITQTLIAGNDTTAIFEGAGTSRPPLAVTFTDRASGEDFTVVVNHLKSKGSVGNAAGDADQGDGQSASNASRVLAAQAMVNWLETNPTGSETAKQIIMGDLNSYAKEDPIQLLLDNGFVDIAQRFLDDAYGYLFDGQLGTLDYILASVDMVVNVLDAAIARFNSDESSALDYNLDFGRNPAIFEGDSPVRSSDHDPVMVGVSFHGQAVPQTTKLQLLHLSDGEAGLLTPQTAPWLAALVDAFEESHENTLILSGGDNFLPGPFSAAGTDPSLNAVIGATATFRPDIAIHNAIGVEVSAIGNHEFDLGSNAFSDAIGASGTWEGAQFVHVSANIDFTGDPLASRVVAGGQDAASLTPGAIAPWVTVDKSGERIGILGATTQILANISSPSGATITGFDGEAPRNDMALLASQLQPIIDEMKAQGINKIILQSHLQQIEFEQELARLLDGVDIILAAGSNTRLGDANDTPVAFPGHDPVFQGNYPLTATSASGEPMLIVNTDNEYTYLGRLVVEFDRDGVLLLNSLDETINGAYAATEENVAAAWNGDLEAAFADGTRGGAVKEITDAVNAVLLEKDGNVLGYTNVYLEGERVQVRGQETNLGSLTADANAFAAREALDVGEPFVVSLKNGGGIRAQIGSIDAVTGEKLPTVANEAAGKPAGAISQLDIENALRFDNKLMVFDTTAQGLLNIIDYAAGIPNNNGGFPQVGGLRYSYTEGAPAGSRVSSIALVAADGSLKELVRDGQIVEGAPERISVVTLNFTANNGDGYPIKANGENFRYLLNDGTLSAPVDEAQNFTQNVPANALGEQQAFGDYLRANYATPQTAYNTPDTPEAQDERIQNLTLRPDTVFDPEPGQPIEPGQPGQPGEPQPEPPGDEPGSDDSDDDFVAENGQTTLTFTGNLADYAFDNLGGFITVRGEGEGTDRLFGFGRLEFADGFVDLRTDSPFFDPLYYALTNGDVFRAGAGSLDHFRAFGEAEGRDPNLFFDVSGYLAANPDIANSAYGALEHFLLFGASENRDTSLDFDARLYLLAHEDVAAAGIGALEHYLQNGRAEGRETFAMIGESIAEDGFDEQFYLFANPDVAEAGINAREHFAEFGAAEGRLANRFFDPAFYLEQNRDVAEAGIDPLQHYNESGWREGRDPSALFDTDAYLRSNTDVEAANLNPLQHYLEFGIYESRNIDDVLSA